MNNLAEEYRTFRRFEKAIPLFRETVALSQSYLGDNHPSTLSSMGNLGGALVQQRRT